MVSNDEISQRLMARREGKSANGYLVCNNCGGYYELQQGESWRDFDTECGCGGQLVQSATDSLRSPEDEYERKRYDTEIILAYVLLIFFAIVAPIMGLYLITRDNERAKLHGKIVLAVSVVLILFVYSIAGLLIYRAYFSQPTLDPATDIENVRSMRLFATCFLNLKIIF